MVLRFQQITQPFAIALITLLSSTSVAIAVETQDTKARLLSDIAFQYAELGKSDRSIEVLEQSLPLTRAMKSKCYQANTLAKVAGSYFLLEKNNLAQPLLTEAVQTAKAQDATGCSSSATSPTESLNNRAKDYAKAGHFDLAIDLSSKLGDPVTMADMAGHLEAAGQFERASKILDQAIELAQKMDSPQISASQFLLVMAEHLRAAERPTLVPRLLQRSLDSISAKPSAPIELQIAAMLQIATSFAGIQSNAQSLAVLDRVMPKIQSLPKSNVEKIRFQVQAASQYSTLGQPSRTTELLTEALANAQNLPQKEDRINKAMALSRIAEEYAKLGDFEQALKIARSMEKVQGRVFAYEKIAVVYAIEGKPDEAVKLAQLSGNRNGVLIGIVRYYLTQKQPDQALKFVQTHQVKDIASDVALGYLEVGQPEQALNVVQMNDLDLKDQKIEWVLPHVARGFAEKRQFNSALDVTQTMNNKPDKIQALIAIAQSYTHNDAAKLGGFSGLMSNVGNWVQDLLGDSDREHATKALDQALEITRSL